MNGQRRVDDERQLMTELSKLFHTVRASHKEQSNQKKSRAAGRKCAKATRSPPSKEERAEQQRSKRAARKKGSGGSIWILFKGGFSDRNVPSEVPANLPKLANRARRRFHRSMEQRTAAVSNAEDYLQSAWQQAEEAGFLPAGTSPDASQLSDEGEVYMREQFAAAAMMLAPCAPGGLAKGHLLRTLLKTRCGAADGADVGGKREAVAPSASSGSGCPLPPLFVVDGDEKKQRQLVEELATRELAILASPLAPNHSRPKDADSYVRNAREQAKENYYFKLSEPLATSEDQAIIRQCEQQVLGATSSTTDPAVVDIRPTKCVVRIRNSQLMKHTAIISTPKGINYFRSNIGQVLRKELANSKLPRGPPAEGGGSTSAAGTGASNATTSHNNNNNSNNGGGANKKKRRR